MVKVPFFVVDASQGKALEGQLRTERGTARFFHCDLKDIEALEDATVRLAETLGPVAVLSTTRRMTIGMSGAR